MKDRVDSVSNSSRCLEVVSCNRNSLHWLRKLISSVSVCTSHGPDYDKTIMLVQRQNINNFLIK